MAGLSDLAVPLLATLAAGGIAYVLIFPLLSNQERIQERRKAFVAPPQQRALERNQASARSRREQVAQSLKELEARQKARHKLTIEGRLAQAGLDWTRRRFFVVSGLIGVVLAFILLLASENLLIAAAGLFVGGLGIPRWLVGYLARRRMNRFLEEFPNALDIIVRGIRAGLPVGDCIKIIAAEAAEPVKSEFRVIVESQVLGLPVAEAVARLPERMPLAEANFFAIVIAIQQQSGGNLSEAISNVSRVLRERKKMKGKIQAMSMEAKASAGIIASLPFVVMLLVYLTSPHYVSFLWTTSTGNIALGASALWMLLGCLVIRQMIHFDF